MKEDTHPRLRSGCLYRIIPGEERFLCTCSQVLECSRSDECIAVGELESSCETVVVGSGSLLLRLGQELYLHNGRLWTMSEDLRTYQALERVKL